MRKRIFATVAILVVLSPISTVLAQGVVEANTIIRALKPTSQPSGSSARGIKVVPDGAPSGTQAAAPSAPPQQVPSIDLTLVFPSSSAELTAQAKAALDQLGRAIASKDLSVYRFRIEGHTDTVGTAEYNLDLSRRRAEAAASYLTTTYGIDQARLVPVGVGSTQLAVQTGAQVDEPRNRRVHVVNLGS